jgi:uncharacterized cupredoxin-like copper-binding protein
MTPPARRPLLSRRGLLTASAAVVLLTAGSTVAVAAASGGFASSASSASSGSGYGVRGASCAAPTLPGTTVSVQLADVRSMMTRSPMMGGSGAMMGPGDWRNFHRGMMRVLASPTSVAAGTVSLTVVNTGYLTHELVVLPLAARQQPGARNVGADGTVDEAASLGEASASCAAGAGDGIAAGSTGWVSLHLPAGRYELVCNLPGHYAAGMFAELDIA